MDIKTYPSFIPLFFAFLLLASCAPIDSERYFEPYSEPYDDSGYAIASWYGRELHGKRTSSGQPFNMHAFTCAHRTYPFGTKLKITNPANGHLYRLTEGRYWGIHDESANVYQPDWFDAEAEAESWGGHLVTINDPAENQWLVATFGANQEFWIGLTDWGSEHADSIDDNFAKYQAQFDEFLSACVPGFGAAGGSP